MSSARSFAIIQQFMLGDLEALDTLVGDDADELLADDGRDLVTALLRLVSADQLPARLMLGSAVACSERTSMVRTCRCASARTCHICHVERLDSITVRI
jgi:hypothetical protein